MDLTVDRENQLGMAFHGGDIENGPTSSGQTLLYGGLNPFRSILAAQSDRFFAQRVRLRNSRPWPAGAARTCSAPASPSPPSASSSTRSPAPTTPTSCPRLTSWRPTTFRPRSTSARTSRCRPISAVWRSLPGAAAVPRARSAASAGSAWLRLRHRAPPRHRHQGQDRPAPQRLRRGPSRGDRGDQRRRRAAAHRLARRRSVRRSAPPRRSWSSRTSRRSSSAASCETAWRARTRRSRCSATSPCSARSSARRASDMQKSNLILVLTPYIIREQADLRTVFERKMQERQEFLDHYFVFSEQNEYEAPKDYSRTNGLLEDIRQSYIERRRAAAPRRARPPARDEDPRARSAARAAAAHRRGAGRAATRTAPPPPAAPAPGDAAPAAARAQRGASAAQLREDREVNAWPPSSASSASSWPGAASCPPTSSSPSSPFSASAARICSIWSSTRTSPTRSTVAAPSPRRRSCRSSSASIPTRSPTTVAIRVPIAFAKTHKVLVVREDDVAVHVVCGDPFDTQALDDLRVIFGKPVEASGRRARHGSRTPSTASTSARPATSSSRATTTNADEEAARDILDSDEEAPVIRWVNSLFLQAMKERASDIHIEPEEKEVIVRYRIDGELYVARRAPRGVHEQHHQPHQDRELAQHRREAPPPGRPHHEEDRGQELRHPRQHHPDEPRLRAHRHAPAQQVERPARPARPGLQPARVRAHGRAHPAARTASSWSRAPPAAARRRRSTRASTASTSPTSTS